LWLKKGEAGRILLSFIQTKNVEAGQTPFGTVAVELAKCVPTMIMLERELKTAYPERPLHFVFELVGDFIISSPRENKKTMSFLVHKGESSGIVTRLSFQMKPALVAAPKDPLLRTVLTKITIKMKEKSVADSVRHVSSSKSLKSPVEVVQVNRGTFMPISNLIEATALNIAQDVE